MKRGSEGVAKIREKVRERKRACVSESKKAASEQSDAA